MSLSPLEYLRHIQEEAAYLEIQVKNRNRGEFAVDETAMLRRQIDEILCREAGQ